MVELGKSCISPNGKIGKIYFATFCGKSFGEISLFRGIDYINKKRHESKALLLSFYLRSIRIWNSTQVGLAY